MDHTRSIHHPCMLDHQQISQQAFTFFECNTYIKSNLGQYCNAAAQRPWVITSNPVKSESRLLRTRRGFYMGNRLAAAS